MSEPADLPAWSLPAGAGDRISIGVEWPERVTRDWAFGEATGKGVRVCILDSGIEAGHPQVGSVEGAVAFHRGQDEGREPAVPFLTEQRLAQPVEHLPGVLVVTCERPDCVSDDAGQ